MLGSLVALALALGGGFVLAARLSQAHAGVSAARAFTLVSTVQQRVTLRVNGKTVVRRVPIVRRVLVHPQTVYETRIRTHVVSSPGSLHVVTNRVPVVRRTVVTVAGQKVVHTQTRLVPVTRTQMLTQTQMQTVTNSQTVVTTVPVTTTVRQATTVKQATTVRQVTTVVSTETLPAETRTVTQPVTVTRPGVTVTSPSVTVTVTVTAR